MFSRATEWEKLSKALELRAADLSQFELKDCLLLLSGGADSMLALFWLLLYARKFSSQESSQKTKLILLYVDHYRGHQKNEAALLREQLLQQVKATVEQEPFLEVEFLTLAKDAALLAKKLKTSFEFCAAQIRYKAIYKIYQKYSVKQVITGHNLSDYFETLYMRMQRGTSFEKMMPFHFIEFLGDLQFIRPLFNSTRESVRKICQREGLTYWQDPSNDDEKILRNRVRKNIPLTNVKGFQLTLKNLLQFKNKFLNNNIDIHSKFIQELKPFREYHIDEKYWHSLDPHAQENLLRYLAAKAGIFSMKKNVLLLLISQKINRYKNIFFERECWHNHPVMVFRRGLSDCLPYSFVTENHKFPQKNTVLDYDSLTKAATIQLSYGRKSVKKMINEKKISPRQKKFVKIILSKNEIVGIDFSALGMPNVFSIQRETDVR